MDKDQIFLHHRIYPKASDIFNVNIKPIQDIIDDCIFVIDTNVLLLPYTTTSSGFEEIKKAFSKLIEKNQLLIPAQVAREFAKNRPEKIKTLFQQLNVIKSKIHKPVTGQYPLLESLAEYKEAVVLEKEIQDVQNKYAKKINEILENVKQWRWDDPVSSVYKELFKPEFIKDLNLSEDDIIKDLERRNKYSIPPGFNDKSKDDYGVGDLIIWLTILQIAKELDKDIIFISGDEKNDWFYRSENQSLYPRFELITEFKNNTNDKTFHNIKLSQLLNILGATEEAVKEVEIRETNTLENRYNLRNFGFMAEKIIYKWLKDTEGDIDIIHNTGFPDFIIRGAKNEGIDVLPIRNNLSNSLLNKIKERIMRASLVISEGNFDCFRIFIVLESVESSDRVFENLALLPKSYKNEFIQINIGVITDEGEFLQML